MQKRMGWDSNPRYPYEYAGYQDRCLKPLSHPSGSLQARFKRTSKAAYLESPAAQSDTEVHEYARFDGGRMHRVIRDCKPFSEPWGWPKTAFTVGHTKPIMFAAPRTCSLSNDPRGAARMQKAIAMTQNMRRRRIAKSIYCSVRLIA